MATKQELPGLVLLTQLHTTPMIPALWNGSNGGNGSNGSSPVGFRRPRVALGAHMKFSRYRTCNEILESWRWKERVQKRIWFSGK